MTDASSRQRRIELTHIDGLDGLRGLAVAAVVLFHGNISWAKGGFMGVELFFVLSGFLITSLLVREWMGTGGVVLSNFWARRARRLLPALFVLVVVIGIYYSFGGTLDAVPGLFGDGLSALFYYSNWHQIATGGNYFVQNGPQSPFQHTWSLAIEEQFYVVWPLVVLGMAWLVTRRRRGSATAPTDAQATRWLDVMLALALVLLVGSAVDMLILHHSGASLNRVYMGTDTRASGLLAGAALAVLIARLRMSGRAAAGSLVTGDAPATHGHDVRRGGRSSVSLPLISVGSAAAVIAACALMATVNGDQDSWLYPWGFLLIDGLSVLLIATIITAPRAIASRLFSLEPMRWLGKISYGLYLWHFPLFLWIHASGHLVGWKLFLVQVAASLIISTASYFLVEQPIRQRRWPVWIVRGLAPLTAGAGVIALAVAVSAAAVPSSGVSTKRTNLTGTQNCVVHLANTPSTGEVPPPKPDISSFQIAQLDRGAVSWPVASANVKFHVCPTPKALLIGDSLAFTIGVPYLYNEADYGMAISNAATLGCAFGIKGQLDVNGVWENPPKVCPNEISTLSAEANAFGATEIIFELGYRDEFNWRWGGKLEHLGMPAFDNYVMSRMKKFISVLGENGKRKLLFLSIPLVSPQPFPDGTAAPQGSMTRHDEINKMITAAAKSDSANATVLDIDDVLSPGDTFHRYLNGKLCRFDNIHVTVYCSSLLEKPIFEAARGLLDPKLKK